MNINEIARLAGVSRATVSRYLNNGYVSEEKKKVIDLLSSERAWSRKNLYLLYFRSFHRWSGEI